MRLIVSGAILMFFFLLEQENVLAQDTYLPYSAGKTENKGNNLLYRNLEITGGYIPKSDNERLKSSIAVNNLLFHRLGAYTSFEYDLTDKKVINTCGATITLHRFVYLWGRADVFSKNGVIQSGIKGPRKEAGVGITPYKFLVMRVGWSNSVGVSIAAGARLAF